MSRWVRLAMALLVCAWPLAAQEEPAAAEPEDVPGAPPAYPGADRVLSTTVRAWHIGLVEFAFIDDARLRRVTHYLADLPGEPPKLRVYKGPKVPATAPRLIQDFYLDWAKQAGYRLVVDVRLGVAPGATRGTAPEPVLSATPRANDTWPPVPPHTKLPFADRQPWELEYYTWISVFYRPGEEGGAFVSVWMRGMHVWVFKPGHVAIGPVLAEFLALPELASTEEAPATVEPEPPVPPIPGMPVAGDTGFFVRAELGKWEIDSLVRDVGARARLRTRASPLEAMLAAGPQLFASVRHVWVTTYQGHPDFLESCVTPWLEWIDGLGWRRLVKAEYNGVPVRIWHGAGAEAGAAVIFDTEQSSTVLVCSGAPNLFALMPVLGTLGGSEGK